MVSLIPILQVGNLRSREEKAVKAGGRSQALAAEKCGRQLRPLPPCGAWPLNAGENHLFFTGLDVLTSSSLIDSQVYMNLTPQALLLSAAVWDPCRQVLLHPAQTSLLALSGLPPLIPQQHFEAEATVIPSLYTRNLMPREVK